MPATRARYLAEIAANGRRARDAVEHRAEAASRAQQPARGAAHARRRRSCPRRSSATARRALADGGADAALSRLRAAYNDALEAVGAEALALLRQWPAHGEVGHRRPVSRTRCAAGRSAATTTRETLSHNRVPKLAVPRFRDWGEHADVPAEGEPARAVSRTRPASIRTGARKRTRRACSRARARPERTNRRFHYVAGGHGAARLSTAFDSTTLYGEDPDERPDIYGRIGNSGVSIATLDDMKKLYSGFDLCAPTTSVSMTINGPAPMILAMFMNTAIDQRVERHLRDHGPLGGGASRRSRRCSQDRAAPGLQGRAAAEPRRLGPRPARRHGRPAARCRRPTQQIRAETLSLVRGTVQADILKEDQAQNTCIFSTEFALRMMGDVQQFFIDNDVRNFYSVSISGYHIAEAGANPISQLAFTLANGFTIVEYYLARGMKIDDFAPNLSFFFSNGMDPEYAVIGRVARRIWARAMRDLYGAGPRSQMLKYHIQTSGRSLHAQEIQFNDIRTTLQALYALFDNCNSLHTNAYDEAITTPTEESVRRAVAIQLIIGKELGLNKTQNPWQGSFAIEELTDLVEEAVYREFDRISERGGVLGAMETMYQRGKIQEESLYYETLKHDGTLPIIGVNTFLAEGRCGRRDPRRRADPLDRRGEAGPGRGGARVPGAQRGAAAGGARASAATGGRAAATCSPS